MDHGRRLRHQGLERFMRDQVTRRQFLRRSAGAAALPLAARAGLGAGAAAFTAFTPAAVSAAQRKLQETGDSAEAAVAAAQEFSGTTLTFISEAGLQAEDPKEFSGPMWEELTGIRVEVVELPFNEVFTAPVQEHIAGTGAFDVLQIVPSWLGDFVGQGIAEPLDPFIEQYMNPADLDDFHPMYRDLMNYGGQIYGLFDDGDVLILYYRTDLFEDPANQEEFQAQHGYELAAPATWEQYDQIQAFFTEKMAPEVYGGASQRQPSQVYEWFIQEFRVNGGRFFDPETMDALLDSEAGVETLSRMLASNETMPPGVETWGFVEVLEAWMAGDLAMVGATWPPYGRFSEAYGADTRQLEWVPASQIAGNVGYGVMPGGYSQHAAGFMLGVSSTSQNKEAAYLFAQWLNSPSISLERCMLPYSLRDPFRLSHYESEEYRALWPNAGWYLDTLREAADNALLDIIMPGSAEYHDAIDRMFGAAQSGTDIEQALADGSAAFDAITDRIGRDAQRDAYEEFRALEGAYPE